jgi:colanic acid/amylovoran biosynthesis glycosyltransferase
MSEESARSSTRKGPIAYIAHFFPSLNQTFVYREILGMEELGWKVLPFSIRRPSQAIPEEARKLAERTVYVFPVCWGSFLARQMRLFLAHPARYLGILLYLLTRRGESFRARLHGLTHFFGGMHLVPELRQAGVRHVHAHFGRNPATLALVAAEYLRIPFSVTIHAWDLFVDPAYLRAKIEKAKFIVTISRYNLELLRKLARTPQDAARIHVVHCGIDLGKFAPRAGASPAAEKRLLFVSVGRLVQKKGHSYLVEAARVLKERNVPFEVQVIGAGPDREKLSRRIEELELGDVFHLAGSMPEEKLLPILREADAFVLPCVLADDGDKDGIPVSLMEAMAYGIPCVSTDISGIPELISSGRDGLLVPQKDSKALAGALERLAGDPGLREGLGKAGRRKVEAEFTLQGQVRALDKLVSS